MGLRPILDLKYSMTKSPTRLKIPSKTTVKKKRENVFKLFALLKMKVKPTRGCIQKTEEESSREKCRRSLTITTVETPLLQGALFFTDRRKPYN